MYVPCFIHSTLRWSRLAGNIRVLAPPFSTHIPDLAAPHTFLQPIDCLIPFPGRGDRNRESGTSGWIEGVTTPPPPSLVPVPGCQPGSEPATCPRTPPAGRQNLPLPPPLTGRKSSAGPETPPLVLILPWDPVRPRIDCTMHDCGARMRNNSRRRRGSSR